MIPDEKNHFHMRAQLTCGAWVEIVQRNPRMILEVTVTPVDKTEIKETAYIKDGLLHINVTSESMIGIYQILRMVLGQDLAKKKKFLGIF